MTRNYEYTRNYNYAICLMSKLTKRMSVAISYNAEIDVTTITYGKAETRMLCIDNTMDDDKALDRYLEMAEIIEKMKAESNDTV